MGRLAARMAGGRPPMMPMSKAKMNAADKQSRRDTEGESQMRERLPVHRACGEAIQRQDRKTSEQTADK